MQTRSAVTGIVDDELPTDSRPSVAIDVGTVVGVWSMVIYLLALLPAFWVVCVVVVLQLLFVWRHSLLVVWLL